jgi:hypothetical protein
MLLIAPYKALDETLVLAWLMTMASAPYLYNPPLRPPYMQVGVLLLVGFCTTQVRIEIEKS